MLCLLATSPVPGGFYLLRESRRKDKAVQENESSGPFLAPEPRGSIRQGDQQALDQASKVGRREGLSSGALDEVLTLMNLGGGWHFGCGMAWCRILPQRMFGHTGDLGGTIPWHPT